MVSLESSVLTDHKVIFLSLNTNISKEEKTCTYWKMNQNILTDVQFRDEAKKIIIDCWNEANVTKLFGVNWELTKYQIRSLARRGKEIAKLRREKEEKIVHEIIRLSGDCNINQENKNNLLQLQFELDRIY